MANFPLKLLVSFLQTRSLQTKASKLLKPSPKTSTKTGTDKKARAPLLSVEEREKAVIALLKSQHFSDTQIAELTRRYPTILKAKVSTTLDPKLKFFNDNGYKGTLLPDLIMSNPIILRRSLTAQLIPAFEFLKTQLGNNNEKALHTVIRRASWILTSDLEKVLLPNICALEKAGVPRSNILKLFSSQPRSLLPNTHKVVRGIEMTRKFGIKPDDGMFVHAFRVLVCMNESNWNKKVETLKSLGWSNEDIVSTVVRQPLCLTCSEEKLRSTMEFLVNTMKLEPKTIIACPKLIMHSLKKRIIPRFNVVMILQEKKLLGKRKAPSFVNISEEDFMRKYITKYINKVPHLLDVYRGNWKIDAAFVRQ